MIILSKKMLKKASKVKSFLTKFVSRELTISIKKKRQKRGGKGGQKMIEKGGQKTLQNRRVLATLNRMKKRGQNDPQNRVKKDRFCSSGLSCTPFKLHFDVF
jgi:hypothetical protein